MLVRGQYTERFNHALAVLNQELRVLGKLNLQSQPVHAEDFYLRLLNKLYGWNLVNDNERNPNAEAVDLIDEGEKLFVQVTITCDPDKVSRTLGKQVMQRYAERGYHVMFLFVGEQRDSIKKSKAIRNPHGVTFDQNVDLVFTKDLVERFMHSDVKLQKEILQLVALETKEPGGSVTVMEGTTTSGKPKPSVFSRALIFMMLIGVVLFGFVYFSRASTKDPASTEGPVSTESSTNENDSNAGSINGKSSVGSDDSENPWDAFPRTWSGSYTGHSSWSATGDVKRHIDIDLESVSESGALRGTCEVNSEDSGEGHMRCKYVVDGKVDWQTGEIELSGVSWIDQGEFSWMTNFRGNLDEARLTVTGYCKSAREGSDAGDWNMNAVTD